MRNVLIAAACGLVIAGCGTTTRIIEQHTVTQTITRVVTDTVSSVGAGRFTFEREPGGNTCTIQLDGYDAVAWFGSRTLNVNTACAAVTDLGAAMGDTWVNAPTVVHISASGQPSVLVGGDTLVCEMLYRRRVTAYVWDSGSQDYGRQLCENLSADDWLAVATG